MKTIDQYLRGNQGILEFGGLPVVWRQLLRNVLGFALFEVAFYFAYRYGNSFGQTCASPFWFPDSVLLCALLLSRPGRWWIFVLAPLPIRLLAAAPPDVPMWFLLTTFTIDSAKGLLTAAVLRRFGRSATRAETVPEFALFCLVAVLVVPVLAAFAGATARHFLGHSFWPAWEQWFLGNALTHLIITPAILYWVFGATRNRRLPSTKQCLEAGVLAVGLILTGYMAFDTRAGGVAFAEPRFYAPVPFLFWAAIRFGMFGASGAIMILAFLSVAAALTGRGPFAGQSPGDTALSLQHFLLLRAAPLYLVAILTQQRKGDEGSMRESEARFRNLADTTPVMIWMSGSDKRCVYFNRQWLDFTGRAQEMELGDGWVANVHPDDAGPLAAGYRAAFDSRQASTLEYRLRRRDGQYRWILAHAVPRLTADGGFLGYIGSCQDITDRKQMEETNRNLAHMHRLAVMGELTAIIAHEVKQPLGAILSNAEAAERLLETEQPPLDEIRHILEDIRKDDLRADEAILRIRALIRKREMQLEPLDLNETVRDVLRFVASDASRKGVRILAVPDGSLPLVCGDRVHLQQLLLNLIFNGMDAMKDTPESARQITVRTKRNGSDAAEVEVADCGCGIPPDHIARIFESFYTTKKEGMGLGLSIGRSIMQAHQGRLWAENNAAEGATFHFTVPLVRGAGDRAVISNQ